MTHDVFISYSKYDKPTADAACARLESAGIRCWIAPRDIIPGHEWSQSLVAAIRGSAVFVLVFSSHANTSPQIRREVDRAVHHGIPIIPFRIEAVEPTEGLEYYIAVPHWLDAMTPPLDRHLDSLCATVGRLLPAAPQTIGDSGETDDQQSGQSVPEVKLHSTVADQHRGTTRHFPANKRVLEDEGSPRAGMLQWLSVEWKRWRLNHAAKRKVCPYCGSIDSLQDDPDEPTVRRCRAEVDHRGTTCPYAVLRRLENLPLLQFTVCGTPDSGKSAWIAQILNELDRGATWPFLELSDANPDKYRDRMMDKLGRAQAPLTGDDRDVRWNVAAARPTFLEAAVPTMFGKWRFVVSLIDFASGEFVANLTDPYRRRAMQTDGMLMFFSSRDEGLQVTAALRCLVEDYLHPAHSRGVVPFAICCNKLDLDREYDLFMQSHFGRSDSIRLREIGKANGWMSDVLRRRFQVDIANEASRQLGSRHLLFPMTVGIDQSGSEQHDVLADEQAAISTQWTGRPRGIFQPILWLLHWSRVITLPE